MTPVANPPTCAQNATPGSAGPAEEVAKEIRTAGGKAVSNSDSVSDYDAVAAMFEQAKKEFGGLHAVINPAGILRDGMFHADLHMTKRARAFVEFKSGVETGRVGGPRASDEDRLDVNQAFVDIRIGSLDADQQGQHRMAAEGEFGEQEAPVLG